MVLVRGSAPGPVLALVAGTHGYEYPGISALQRLRQSVDPRALRGTLVLVHIANPPSFYGRTIYTSPADGKNLNRVFPGRPDGTLSERIAHAITTEVIAKADYLVDLQAGDGNEALRPNVYMPDTGDARLDAATRGMALAFGLDHVVIDAARVRPGEATQFVDQTALARGVPAITTETGQLGQNDEHSIALAEHGIRNLMRHLGMIDGKAETNPGVVWLSDYEVIRSPANGVFRRAVRDGYAVAQGGLMGELFDQFGASIGDLFQIDKLRGVRSIEETRSRVRIEPTILVLVRILRLGEVLNNQRRTTSVLAPPKESTNAVTHGIRKHRRRWCVRRIVWILVDLRDRIGVAPGEGASQHDARDQPKRSLSSHVCWSPRLRRHAHVEANAARIWQRGEFHPLEVSGGVRELRIDVRHLRAR
jgi:hypothetical protein